MQIATLPLASDLGPGDAFYILRRRLSAGPIAALHRHEFFELVFVARGVARHEINGHEECLPQGALVFVRPDDCHALCAASDAACHIVNVAFRPEIAAHLAARYGSEFGDRFFWSDAALPETHFLSGPRIERAANELIELADGRRGLVRIEQFLLSLMTRIVDYPALLPADAPRWLQGAMAAARLPEVFGRGAAGFVAAAGRGHAHVCRVCRAYLGVSPTTYVNRMRMEFAAQQLGATDLPVADIAAACGIGNLSHFYRLFRTHYGRTPTAYRRDRHARAQDSHSA